MNPPPSFAPHRSAHLRVLEGTGAGRRFPLGAGTEGAWLIGRRPDLPVALDGDPFVSRENTEVRRHLGGFEVIDLPQSQNGTRLNGKLLPKGVPHRLRSGDVLEVGTTRLAFELG